MNRLLKFFVSLLFFLISFSTFAQSEVNERAKWFVNDRYGMFIHWGVYSGMEGVWKGEKLRYANDYAEWIKYRNSISNEEYIKGLDQFNWDLIDVEEWVLLAKQAGMKYITITAKHHDGFALWNSVSNKYNIANYTEPKRDVIAELAAACKKHNIKLGLYYSHWVDWQHEFGWSHKNEIYPLSAENYDKYWQEKVIPQLTELLTNYGTIDLIWFDMWINHKNSIITKAQLQQVKQLIRNLQPNCLINSRLGLSLEEDSDIDFLTLGDNQFGEDKLETPWQSPATVAHSWGFSSYEKEWKSSTSLLQNLIKNVALNGNMMLNIGPRANGNVPLEIKDRLLKIGNWLAINGDAIYGASAFDLPVEMHDWGYITSKQNKTNYKLYLHVFNSPLWNKLVLTGVTEKPNAIKLLANNEQLNFKHESLLTTINFPNQIPEQLVTVLELTYNTKPKSEPNLIAINSSNGFSLKPNNAFNQSGNSEIVHTTANYGSIPIHAFVNGKQMYKWQVYLKAGNYNLSASYAHHAVNKATLKAELNKEIVTHQVIETGYTVPEPNEDLKADNFKSSTINEYRITAPGIYTLSLEISTEKDSPVMFNWLWLEKLD